MNNTEKALFELFVHNKLDAAQLAADMINLVKHFDWVSKGALDAFSTLLPLAELSIKLGKKFTEYKLALFIEQVRNHTLSKDIIEKHI